MNSCVKFSFLLLFSFHISGCEKAPLAPLKSIQANQHCINIIDIADIMPSAFNEEGREHFKKAFDLIDLDTAVADIFDALQLPYPGETDQDKLAKIALGKKTFDNISLSDEQALLLVHQIEAEELFKQLKNKQPELYPWLMGLLSAKGAEKQRIALKNSKKQIS